MGNSWKTTVSGIIGGSILILQTILKAYQTHTPIDWHIIEIAFIIMVLSVLMKDFNVTGETKKELPPEKTLRSLD